METGLMPQIQTLIAPPPSESPPKLKRKEREDKRRGKGQNRDTCDACGDCGSLICCEKCPTALHLQCQDPPLEEDDVPLGEWLCRVCKAKAMKPKDKKCLEPEPKLKPIEMLIKATEQQNPGRYTLGRKYNINMPFPGAEKGPKKVITRRTSSLKKNPPDQVKICFECRRGVRVAPLLHCDYCSLSYHMDCLDPPLTILPLGTWMCPNHPEQFLDANMLQTTSGVERAEIWAKVAKEFDQEALKLEFMRKVTRKNPPFRFKVKKPLRPRALIPPAVVSMYQNPVPLVPSLPNNVKFEKTWKVGETPTQTEINDWLSSLFAMQVSLAWDMSIKPSPETDVAAEDANNSPKNPEMVEEMMEQMFNSKSNKKINRTAIENFCSQLESISGPVEAHISKMDPRLLKLLAAQRLQQVIPQLKEKNNTTTAIPRHSDTKVKIKEEPLPNEVYAVFDDNLFLKNGVICAKKKYVALKDINGGLKVEEWKDQKRAVGRTGGEAGEESAVVAAHPAPRAALAPVGSLTRIAPVPMRFRTLTIGTSPDSDVCLSEFGVCQFTSPKHAVIFFDVMTGEYELLNYSPHGSVVDGCLYCIDATQWRIPSAPPVADPLTQSVRAMLDKRRGLKRDSSSATTSSVQRSRAQPRRQCGCPERVSDPTGWEGSALLHHCSHLQFGCLQFVFSIVDFAPSKVLSADEVEKKKKKVEENGEVSSTIEKENNDEAMKE